MRSPTVYFRRAFTLIELLVVISILAILMGLLFPAVQGALDSARKTQAKNDATQIASAIQAYATEYGKMPPPVAANGDSSADNTNDDPLWNALSPSASAPSTDNPRGLVFLEVPRARSGKNGRADGKGPYLDPWGHPYQIVIDGNYDNEVDGPDGSKVQKTVIVWSFGKNGVQDTGTTSTGGKKADDVHSWE